MTVTEIKAKAEEQKIKRLAAYCRVSTDKEDQLHSFAAQIRYYMNYADEHKEYKLVDVYADEGLSGKSLKNRDEMNRLLKDCESGKVDCIIVKSVSRFARNTQELLSTLRMLRGIGVTVYFEEQGIDTSKMNNELFITFPGMIAQQESEAISGNVRWSILEQMKNGEYTPHIPPYGYKTVRHNRIREDKVYEAFSLLTYRLKSNTAIIETVIKQLEKLQGRGDVQNEIYEIDRRIAQLSARNHVLAKLNKSGVMKAADFAAQSNEIQNKINALRQQRKKKLSASEEDEILDELQQLLDTVSNCQPTPEFDCDLFDKIVKRVDCIDRETLRFALLGELKIIEKVRVT